MNQRTVHSVPTLADFVRHADRFGTDQVYETAEGYLSGSELLQLDRELTRIDGERRRRFARPWSDATARHAARADRLVGHA